MEVIGAVGTNASQKPGSQNHLFALSALTSLFFIWGFITCLNDILIPHLKNVFSLSYTQAMLIQFCFFGAYFLVSIPAGMLVKRIGYKQGIIAGLAVAGIGCLLFYPAASLHLYPVFLAALFILASGITILQVSANPYVTILGAPETAASRLTLTQAFNSLGTTVAPFFGAALILSVATVSVSQIGDAEVASVQAEASAVQLPYLLIAATLFVIAVVFSRLKLPVVEHQSAINATQKAHQQSIFSYRHLVLGAVGIFLYVGAEVSIGSFLVSFLGQKNIAGLAEAQAANYIAYYWAGAMIGRFIGAVVMQKLSGGVVLAFNASAAVVLLLVVIMGQGALAMWSILLIGLFNSIMFPVIFSLALNQLGERTSEGSGILCLAIVGGAIVPLLQGFLADNFGLQLAFIIPLLCYLFIVFYGVKGSKPTAK